jgi:hypothetical protein
MGKALKKKMPFPAHLAPKRDGVGHNHERKPKETPLFFELSLCLSRACLGKLMHFIYKRRKSERKPDRRDECHRHHDNC